MNRRVLALLSITIASILVADVANAVPWRRRRTNNNYYYNYDSGYSQIATKYDSDSDGDAFPELTVNYSYDHAMREEVAFNDQLRVTLTIWDEAIIHSKKDLVAEVRLTDLTNSEVTKITYVPVTMTQPESEEYRLAHFDIKNPDGDEALLEPAKVYRMFVNLHRKADKYNRKSAWGRVPLPYYAVTSGPQQIDKARQYIAMRTFKEWYYTERGWPSEEYYVMDCHDYYLWATGTCTAGCSYERASLGYLFSGGTPYHDGSQIAALAEESAIHGDYVRIPGHTFMLLAYDAQYDQVWTMEANYGATIEVAVRSVGYGWTVGHLVGEHIREDMFGGPNAEMMADDEDSEAADMATVMLDGEDDSEQTVQ